MSLAVQVNNHLTAHTHAARAQQERSAMTTELASHAQLEQLLQCLVQQCVLLVLVECKQMQRGRHVSHALPVATLASLVSVRAALLQRYRMRARARVHHALKAVNPIMTRHHVNCANQASTHQMMASAVCAQLARSAHTLVPANVQCAHAVHSRIARALTANCVKKASTHTTVCVQLAVLMG